MLLRFLHGIGLCLGVITSVYAVKEPSQPRPLVIWHGLGDSAHSKGMLEFIDLVKGVHPGIFVHSVYIKENEDDDRKAGFFGNLDVHLQIASEQLKSVPELAGGFDGIGFSQGGQFLRAYVQLHNSPPMHNLITFGSQHMGISELPACRPFDILCRLLYAYGKGRVYSDWAQNNVVPAQYFRDTAKYATYLQKNHWLPAINNEIASSRNETYAKNFASLKNLVLVIFANDTTVTPKESGWFESYETAAEDSVPSHSETFWDESDSSNEGDPFGDASRQALRTLPLVAMRDQPLYKEDWIGLRMLDERGAVLRLVCNGPHMHISRRCWKPLVEKYVGGSIGRGTSPLIAQQPA